jgi:hypothetical protein
MKKLLTLCFFMAVTLASQAQVKKATPTKAPVKKVTNTETAVITPAPQKGPTKEQTIAFIKDYLQNIKI